MLRFKVKYNHLKSTHLRSSHPRRSHNILLKAGKYLKKFVVHSVRMLNLSLKELKTESKNRSIKGLKGMSIDKLLGILDKLELVKKTQDIRGIRKNPTNKRNYLG